MQWAASSLGITLYVGDGPIVVPYSRVSRKVT